MRLPLRNKTLTYNKEFEWTLSAGPGREPLNPWNISDFVIPGGGVPRTTTEFMLKT